VKSVIALIVFSGSMLLGAANAAADDEVSSMPRHMRSEAWATHSLLVAMQDEPPPGPADDSGWRRGGPPSSPEAEERRRRHMEQFRTLKLLELLNLNEDQEVEFLVMFRSVRRDLQDLELRKDTLLEQLAAGIREGNLSDGEIDGLIDAILKVEDDRREAYGRFLDEARGMLTAEQVGKVVIFHERFELELLKAVRGFRERHGGGLGPGDAGERRGFGSDRFE
jgi:hypothetical protein